MAEKTSGQFVGIALFLTLGLAVGYLYFVHDWYWNRSAVICTPEMTLHARQTEYCYVPDPGPEHDQPFERRDFWGGDIISRFFENLSQLVIRWAEETIVPWFYNQVAPGWNAYAADENHRKILAAIVGVLYAASATKVVSLAIEWFHDKVADGGHKP
jgi:hypothetical protein